MSEFDEDHLSDLSEEDYLDKGDRFEREDAFLLANLNNLSVESAAPAAVEMSLTDVGYSRDISEINVPKNDKALFVVSRRNSKGDKAKASPDNHKAKAAPDNQAILNEKRKKQKERRLKKEAKAKLAREQELAGKVPLKYGAVMTLAKRQPGTPAAKQATPQPPHNLKQHLLQREYDRGGEQEQYQAQQQGSMESVWQYMADSALSGESVPMHVGELRAVAPEFIPARLQQPPTIPPNAP